MTSPPQIAVGDCVELTRPVCFNFRRAGEYTCEDRLAAGQPFAVAEVEHFLCDEPVIWIDVPMPRGNVLVPIDPAECVLVEKGACSNENADHEAEPVDALAVRD